MNGMKKNHRKKIYLIDLLPNLLLIFESSFSQLPLFKLLYLSTDSTQGWLIFKREFSLMAKSLRNRDKSRKKMYTEK